VQFVLRYAKGGGSSTESLINHFKPNHRIHEGKNHKSIPAQEEIRSKIVKKEMSLFGATEKRSDKMSLFEATEKRSDKMSLFEATEKRSDKMSLFEATEKRLYERGWLKHRLFDQPFEIKPQNP